MRSVRLTAIILGVGFLSLDFALAYTFTSSAGHLFPATMVLLLLNGIAMVATVLFLMGVQGFKPEFKMAYYFICIGYLTHAVASISYPAAYLGYMSHIQNIIFGDIPMCIGAAFIYIGIRHFGQLLDLKDWAMNPWKLSPIFLLIVAIVWFLPHRPIPDATELVFDINRAVSILEAAFYLLTALLAFRIRRAASTYYSRPLLWFGVTFAVYAATSIAMNVQFYATAISDSGLYFVGTLGALAYLGRGVLSIIAGFSFNKISHEEAKAPAKDANMLDVVVFMASLASQPHEIDPMLDVVREISATHPSQKPLTQYEVDQLSGVYHQLEEYLVTKETIRDFTHESLRDLLQEEFQTLPSLVAFLRSY